MIWSCWLEHAVFAKTDPHPASNAGQDFPGSCCSFPRSVSAPRAPLTVASSAVTAHADSDADRRPGRRLVIDPRRRTAVDHDIVIGFTPASPRRRAGPLWRIRIGVLFG